MIDGCKVYNKYKPYVSKPYELKLNKEKVLEIKQMLADGKEK
ncbi:MAG: hypothetical protein ACOCRK_07475 [bacterium]